MIRNRFFRKAITIFFLLEITLTSIVPAVTWALTAGPTAPEATSFEPVDTTDMVNLNTGDLTYNMPLLEVPGPAGSYPISLSYHAGIGQEEEASWTGLGWTLNPGSITRTVNGIADDFNGSDVTDRIFWEGGVTTTQSFGVSYGIANFATVGAGVTFAQDTYRGFGVGGYLSGSLGYEMADNLTAGINGTVGISPYGGTYASLGIGLTIGSASNEGGVSASIGLSINSSGNVSAGIGAGVSASSPEHKRSFGGSMLGASISSGGSKPSLSVGGVATSVNNSKAGKISTSLSSWSADIPVWYGINVSLGGSRNRYWIDESVNIANYGSLYFPSSDIDLDEKAFDTYHIPNIASIIKGDNPEKYAAGSFADYDQYAINAQGIAGNFRPHHYTLTLSQQNIIKENGTDKQIMGYYIPQHSLGVHYRFINDFSNRVINDAPEIEINNTYSYQVTPPSNTDENKRRWDEESNETYTVNQVVPLYFPYGKPITGSPEEIEPRSTPHVPGSKHIEYFRNDEIIQHSDLAQPDNISWATSKGFIECSALGFQHVILRPGQTYVDPSVGGFKVTNASGVTYHFNLPAYAYDEYRYTQNKDVQEKTSFNDLHQRGKYAYAWYLTAVTGPDYVDRGSNGSGDGILNEYDWGYWVSFEYGKWTNDYQWRNPVEGFEDDLESEFEYFSKGKKELYYLNAIRTKTHTALFVKQLRADSKGTTSSHEESVRVSSSKHPIWIDNGGFKVKIDSSVHSDIRPSRPRHGREETDVKRKIYPVGTLKLSQIILMENDKLNVDLKTLCAKGNNYNHYMKKKTEPFDWVDDVRFHAGDNVLDIYDIENEEFYEKANRIVNFEHDYSLCPNTPNSFDEEGFLYRLDANNSLVDQKLGKLTLKSISFRGKGGSGFLPPVKFVYEPEDIFISANPLDLSFANRQFKVAKIGEVSDYKLGDLLIIKQGTYLGYGFVKEINTNSVVIKSVSNTLPSSDILEMKRTKNPPYNKQLYDFWGNYKPDYENDHTGFERFPTEVSAQSVDAWSLRSIKTSTGSSIKINYESDQYDYTAYTANLKVDLNYIGPAYPLTTPPEGQPYSEEVLLRATVNDNLPFSFDKIFKVGDYIDLLSTFEGCLDVQNGSQTVTTCGENIYNSGTVEQTSHNSIDIRLILPYSRNVIFGGGYLPILKRWNYYGGGLRVKSLGIDAPSNGVSTFTTYGYDFEGHSSGGTTYEPLKVNKPSISSANESLRNRFAHDYYVSFINILTLNRDMPAPAIYYSKVRVGEEIYHKRINKMEKIPEYTIYEFDTFTKDLITSRDTDAKNKRTTGVYKGMTYDYVQSSKTTLYNFTQRLGSLKSITLFNDDDQKVNETVYHYLHDEQSNNNLTWYEYPRLLEKFDQLGVMQETFNHARMVKRTDSKYDLIGIISKKETYPVIQLGSTSINYKTGIKETTKTLAFDFYSGQPVKTLSSDGYGNHYVTETTPAYKIYPQMGLKLGRTGIVSGNKNMLEQVTASATYKVENQTNFPKIALVAASAQTWSDQVPALEPNQHLSQVDAQPGIWRQHASYSFIGNDNVTLLQDGLYPASSVTPFTSWNNTNDVPAGWQKNSEITLYDVNSHALEATDVNRDFAATRMSFDQSRIMATAANAEYREFGFSGAEDRPKDDLFSSDIHQNSNNYTSVSHSGAKALVAQINERGFTFYMIPKQRTYRVSVWSSNASSFIKYKFNTTGAIQTASLKNMGKAGNWYLLEADIPITQTLDQLEVWCEAGSQVTHFDDFRVAPVDAVMTSYVYNEWGELSHILDDNNLYTAYEYDEMGRLKSTYKETFNAGRTKVNDILYHYKGH